MTLLRWIALVCVVLVVGAAVTGWVLLRDLREAFAGFGTGQNAETPTTPEPVYFLQDLPEGEIAVLLHPLLTGGEPLLVRDQAALSAASDTAYVIDQATGGEVFGTVILAMMGANNIRPVLTVYVDRAPVRRVTCNVNQCDADGWINAEFHHDIAGLDALALTVAMAGDVYWDFDAYATAYASVIDDPNIYFTQASQLELAAPDDDQRSYRLLLPSSLAEFGETDLPTRISDLADQLRTAVEGLDVTIDRIDIDSVPNPFVTGQDGHGYPAFGDPEVRLMGYALLTPNIVLSIPLAQEAQLRAALDNLPVSAPDQSLFDAAIDARLAELDLPPCRPICMVDDTRRKDSLELNQFTPPSWDLRVWEVTP